MLTILSVASIFAIVSFVYKVNEREKNRIFNVADQLGIDPLSIV